MVRSRRPRVSLTCVRIEVDKKVILSECEQSGNIIAENAILNIILDDTAKLTPTLKRTPPLHPSICSKPLQKFTRSSSPVASVSPNHHRSSTQCIQLSISTTRPMANHTRPTRMDNPSTQTLARPSSIWNKHPRARVYNSSTNRSTS